MAGLQRGGRAAQEGPVPRRRAPARLELPPAGADGQQAARAVQRGAARLPPAIRGLQPQRDSPLPRGTLRREDLDRQQAGRPVRERRPARHRLRRPGRGGDPERAPLPAAPGVGRPARGEGAGADGRAGGHLPGARSLPCSSPGGRPAQVGLPRQRLARAPDAAGGGQGLRRQSHRRRGRAAGRPASPLPRSRPRQHRTGWAAWYRTSSTSRGSKPARSS